MTYSSSQLNLPARDASPLVWDAPPLTSIQLSSEQIQRAATQSLDVAEPEQQWQAYLNFLALEGFQEWLLERSPELPILPVSLYYPLVSPLTTTLRVADSALALIANGSFNHDTIDVSALAISTADFCVLINVWEEQEQIQIYGYLQPQQLRQQLLALQPSSEQTYEMPLDWFIPEPDGLLQALRTLVPVPVPVPVPQSINVAAWWGDRLDEMAQTLGWLLMPPTPAAPGLLALHLSAVEAFADISPALKARGIAIPSAARGAYQNFVLGEAEICLYAFAWATTNTNPKEWTLLIILDSQPNTMLPAGIRLQVEDDIQTLTDRTLQTSNPDAFLLAQVAGTWEETFRVKITTRNGVSVIMPPFRFDQGVRSEE